MIPLAQLAPRTALTEAQRSAVADAFRGNDTADTLLPILHAVQDSIGYVPDAVVPVIAQHLNLSRADVHGVLSFYHWFRREKPGRHVMHVCRAEACQARGARTLESHILKVLGVDYHQTTSDGAITLEPVYCLGLCAQGPSLMVDGEVIAAMTPDRFDHLAQQLRASS